MPRGGRVTEAWQYTDDTTPRRWAARRESAPPPLSSERLARLLGLLPATSGVVFRLSVPETVGNSAVAALGLDPLEAQIRSVVYLDTPDLSLNRRGIVVRARRVQRRPADTIVML